MYYEYGQPEVFETAYPGRWSVCLFSQVDHSGRFFGLHEHVFLCGQVSYSEIRCKINLKLNNLA